MIETYQYAQNNDNCPFEYYGYQTIAHP